MRRALSLAVVTACAIAGAAASAAPDRHPLMPVWVVQRCSFRTMASIDRGAEQRIAPSTTVRLAHPLHVTPSLGQRGYVFPLLGLYPPFADTFGAPRDVGWHHGDDLFASRGAPVVAVADGVVFSVGWNRIGGRRLWLVDGSGNLFYYAHLQRYSPLAVDGRRVRAGQTLGYVGTSGDAVNTPPHLFFEINPASLRGLGYDGAVDPTRYLRSWREIESAVPAPPHEVVECGRP